MPELRRGEWGRLYASVAFGRKHASVSLAAVGLWTRTLAWAIAESEDGMVPQAIVDSVAGRQSAKLSSELVFAGLWEAVSLGSEYRIHNFADHQTPRSERDRDASQHADRQRRYRDRHTVTRDGSRDASQSDEEVTRHTVTRDASQQNKTKNKNLTPLSPTETSPLGEDASPFVVRVFEAWQRSTGHANAKLTRDRRGKIEARNREGYDEADLVDAVRGWANDPWADRANQNDITQLLRNGATVEKFRDLWRNGRPLTAEYAETARNLDEWAASHEEAERKGVALVGRGWEDAQ